MVMKLLQVPLRFACYRSYIVEMDYCMIENDNDITTLRFWTLTQYTGLLQIEILLLIKGSSTIPAFWKVVSCD